MEELFGCAVVVLQDASIDSRGCTRRAMLTKRLICANEAIRFRAQSSPFSVIYDASISTEFILRVVANLIAQAFTLRWHDGSRALEEFEAHLLDEVKTKAKEEVEAKEEDVTLVTPSQQAC
jgi:hypothetical protein